METLDKSATLAVASPLSSQEAGDRRTQTVEPPQTLNPPHIGVGGGGEESRVSEEVAGAVVKGLGPETIVLDPDSSVESGSEDGLETIVVESHSYSPTEGVELPPDGTEHPPVVNGKTQQNGRSDGAGEMEGDTMVGEETGVVVREKNLFKVGDFVWGKVKSHPWWPGQVYEPSDASDNAKKVRRKDEDRILVAYFGDGTFAWCDPSQLKPFKDDFEQMFRQSISKSFVVAVKESLDEIGRYLQSEMTCSCVPAEARARLSKPPAANAGIRAGVTVPEGRVDDALIVEYVPSQLLERVLDIACDVSITDMLEVVMTRSWFLAFNRGVGWCPELPGVCRQNLEIEDLVDVKVKAGADISLEGSVGVLADAGWLSTGAGVLEEKTAHRKKQRSMAELIAQMDLGMEEDSGDDDDDEEVSTADTQASVIHRRKKGFKMNPDGEIGDAVVEEGMDSGRRERKKSKYLSPPYTMLSSYGKNSVSPKDIETVHPKKDLEASQTKESAGRLGRLLLPSSPSILKCNGEATPEKNAFESEDSASAVKMLSEIRSAALSPLYLKGNNSSPTVRGFFDQYRSSVYIEGSGHQNYEKYLDAVNGVEGKVPQSGMGHSRVLQSGSDGKNRIGPCQETKDSREDKSGLIEKNSAVHKSAGSKGKSGSGRKRRKSPVHENGPEDVKPRGRRKTIGYEISEPEKAKSSKKRMKKDLEANGDTGAALLLTFAEGNALPSKEELISEFSKFGVLREFETELLKDSGCARVVFVKSSDAEKAFNTSDRNGTLGPRIVSYRVRYLHGDLYSPSSSAAPQKPPLEFVKKSLEQMISTLVESSRSGKDTGPTDGLKPETRENLVLEMDGLLKKVNKIIAGFDTPTTY